MKYFFKILFDYICKCIAYFPFIKLFHCPVTQVEWPDPALGPLNTSDRRFPLPGQIGLAQVEHRGNKREMHQQGMNIDPYVFILNQPSERHFNVLARYVKQEVEVNFI